MPHLINKNPDHLTRDSHGIRREDIPRNALTVTDGLVRKGYQAYLVGGCVRDLVAGLEPKDFDVATDARPEEIRKVFRSCRLIGRRFRLAHVHFGRDYIEVATFRGSGTGNEKQRRTENGRILADNVYGSLDEDAHRRDFTVNALYFDPQCEEVLDFVGGFDDLTQQRIRLIGDPEARFREDPVRLLRAVRFAAKLSLDIDPATESPMAGLAGLLRDVPSARLFDEMLKLLMGGHGLASYRLARKYGFFDVLFPDTVRVMANNDGYHAMLEAAMANTDDRIRTGKPVTPAFLFATLLWPAYCEALQLQGNGDKPNFVIRQNAADQVIASQVRRISVPRRFSSPMREIWQMQPRFAVQRGKKAKRLMSHPRFRAAYDFLLLRVREDPNLEPLAQWWTEIQELSPSAVNRRLFGQRRRSRRGRGGNGRGDGGGHADET
ncbi:MAG: polynucleotide adenylyltransferase PcnB [Xanthomonadales bacterium]|nr:polynucleotide adenylyltransferase PcnB [Xanthomonadales bacterium]